MKQIIVLLSALAIMGAGCNSRNVVNKVVNQLPKQNVNQVIVEKGEVPTSVLEKYEEKRLDVLYLNKTTTTKDVCSWMVDTVNLTLTSVKINEDNSWTIVVKKSGKRVTTAPEEVGGTTYKKLPVETWTMSSSDSYDSHAQFDTKGGGRVDDRGGSGFGKMPLGSDILHPVFVSPTKVIFERSRLAC